MKIQYAFVILTGILFAIWFGGFTFYAAVVVPIGTDLLGTSEQGLVTQQATQWLNGLGGLSLLGLIWLAFFVFPHKWLKIWVLLLGLSWTGLLGIHPILDGMMLPGSYEITDPSCFYFWHRIYLWIHTIQWLASLGYFWVFMTFILKKANR